MRHTKQIVRGVLLSWLLVVGATPTAYATSPQSSSSSYQVNEVYFGAGGDLHDCSSNYCAKESAGATGVGSSSSTSYQAHAGFNTDRYPFLEFVINTGSIDMGVLTPGTTKTATATFSVKDYLSSGYVVTAESDPPTNGSHMLSAPSSPTASNSTQEQFGINLVANTSPASFGASPAQIPDNTFSFGQAASGYNTANQYKYVKGDTVASSSQSSGETNYTISYIFNITNLTPAGTYTMNQVLVATATY